MEMGKKGAGPYSPPMNKKASNRSAGPGKMVTPLFTQGVARSVGQYK